MCMCDKDEGYLCFYCECFLKQEVMDVVHKYKNEILDSGDWWHSIPNYDINIHCLDDKNFDSPDAVFNINLYELDLGDTSSYTQNVQFDLEPMTRKEIRLS